eukprot:3204896-Alexandrium_andersonii.AAC.1
MKGWQGALRGSPATGWFRWPAMTSGWGCWLRTPAAKGCLGVLAPTTMEVLRFGDRWGCARSLIGRAAPPP